ncbi:MAG TPA: hypothetical protein VMC09_00300 [Anaerolineales bacterium]|nr:hypothetical protein [Anaerolineales bacterium]
MFSPKRKMFLLNLLIALSLVAAGTAVPSMQAAAVSTYPNMQVTLSANNVNAWAVTVYAGKPLIFRAKVKNIGNTPLQVTANLTIPYNWGVPQNKYSDCPDSLAVRSSCTISWYFIPQGSGQLTLRVYVRGNYKDSAGNAQRITSSPAMIFNVKPARN